MGIDTRLCLPGNAGTNGIADAEDKGTGLTCQFNGRKCVGSLATLRDGNDDVVGIDDGIAVTEFGGIFHFNRNTAQTFKQLLAYQPCMPAGSTGHNDDSTCGLQLLTIVNDGRERDASALYVDASTHAVAKTTGLLEDFLQHEERKAALFQLSQRHVNLLDLWVLRFILCVHDL